MTQPETSGPGFPVQDDPDWRRGSLLHRGDEEPLAVPRDHVPVTDITLLDGVTHRGSEQHDRPSDVRRSGVRCQRNRNGHQLIVARDVEELLSIMAPTHLRAA